MPDKLRENNNIERELEVEKQAHRTAIEAGIAAAELVLRYWPNPSNPYFDKSLMMEIFEKGGTGNYATLADKESERVILEKIKSQPLLVGHRVIAEESDEIKTESEWQWVVDPIDGTPPFKNGLPEFGISIGVLRGQEPRIGVIAMPAQKQLIASLKGEGVFLMSFDGQTVIDLKKTSQSEQPLDRMLIGYDLGYEKRGEQLSGVVAKIADEIGYPVSYGSSSTANFRLAQGLIGGYFCKTPTKFDIGAASAIISELGGVVTDIKGEPIDWSANSVSYLAAINPIIHSELLKLIRQEE